MLGAWSIVHGTDKTPGAVFAAALAERLAAHGKRVLLFELSPSAPALDILLGVSERVVYTLADLPRISPEDAALTVRENLCFIPLGVGEAADSAQIRTAVSAMTPDVVLFSAERASLALAREVSDGVLLLTDASPIGLRAASALAENGDFDGFVLGDFVPTREWVKKTPSLIALADMLGLPLFGILPRIDPNNTYETMGKDFLSAVENMAGRLSGESIPLLRGIPIEGMRRRTFFERISE